MTFLLIILVTVILALGYLVFAQQLKIDKLDKNQAAMMGYFDTINKNEQTLKDDLQKVYNEFKGIKEAQRRSNRPKA
jgi:hypothetical protein